VVQEQNKPSILQKNAISFGYTNAIYRIYADLTLQPKCTAVHW